MDDFTVVAWDRSGSVRVYDAKPEDCFGMPVRIMPRSHKEVHVENITVRGSGLVNDLSWRI